MTWLALLTLAKRAGSGIFAWLNSLSFWQIVSLGLAILLVIQHFQLRDARSDAARWHKQYGQIHDQLEAADARAREAEATAKHLSEQIRKQTDEENRRIAGDADAVRV